jgi:mono/diheme cytochrome c family protein
MSWFRRSACAAGLLVFALGCDSLPGKPLESARPINPIDVTDFNTLWSTQCAGCHGAEGKLAAARPMNDPVYLAVVTDNEMRDVIAHGVAGSAMPGFLSNNGLALSAKQIELVLAGMREHWSDPKALAGRRSPSYRATGSGNVAAGRVTFQRVCASCHGAAGDGKGGSARGSVVDPAFLALVSNQSLRSTVIFGRTDLGMPNWAGYRTGPLSEQDVTDLVAWLASHRVEFPGRPYPGKDQQAALPARENSDG